MGVGQSGLPAPLHLPHPQLCNSGNLLPPAFYDGAASQVPNYLKLHSFIPAPKTSDYLYNRILREVSVNAEE